MKILKVIGLLIVAGSLIPPCLAAKKPGKMQIPPTFVKTTLAKKVLHQQKVSFTGTLAAIQGIVIRPEVPGHITKIYFKSGQVVSKNTPLAQINPSIYQAQLDQALARFKLAKLAHGRAARLFKTHAVSKAELDQAVENMNVEAGEVNELKAKLAQNLIHAPFSGRLGLKQVSLGDYVTIGQAIVNLQALNPLRVEFTVPQVYLAKLAIGQKVNVRIDAYPKEVFPGQIYAYDSKLDTNTRSINVRAKIANPQQKLLPGTFAEVTAFIGPKKPGIMVPLTALMYDSQGAYVYKIVNKHAAMTRVQTGFSDSKNVIIVSGLKENEVVVTAGQIKLRNGAPVIVGR